MKDESTGRLLEAWTATLLAWLAGFTAWTITHVGAIGIGFAILASIWSVRASHETIKLRRAQRKKVEDE